MKLKLKRDQKLLHMMRTLRGQYIANVHAGTVAMDAEVLAEFDKELRYLHEAVLGKQQRSDHPV